MSLPKELTQKAKILCFQCEKCGVIDADTTEEFKAMPKEHQEFLLEQILEETKDFWYVTIAVWKKD